LLEALGLESIELVRRGEGVCYLGGTRQVGAVRLRMLIALRPGEPEVGRRAVGELRAGLAAKGYDQGLLLSPSRLADDGVTGLNAPPSAVPKRGPAMAALCAEHGLGVRRMHLPVDYLDLDFFAELTE